MDHPRSRGEYQQIGEDRCDPLGSSPLSRGILDHDTLTRSAAADHPRSRGEYTNPVAGLRIVGGSSPLSRGILIVDLLVRRAWGIIPALAGNTPRMAVGPWEVRDHPRSRGEYTSCSLLALTNTGSSPLSRGIPFSPSFSSFTRVDHPRSRGEYYRSSSRVTTTSGSSPLSRGIRRRSRGRVDVVRIIPALAGNTPSTC